MFRSCDAARADPLAKAVVWMIGLTAVFAPLAIRRYRRRI
jgi:hypothetical protein